ncbi:alanine/glycine:cation symporter family protein [Actinopolyspora halophila]|uniref:alanine/glycine:cation symporter family protein n=1 Tax=Actinopolyspora halophila TaxID=1850 RepID=UPI000369DE2C|nr:alanine/glycine:cation symporter family protein [Actinopolyspora halophila]
MDAETLSAISDWLWRPMAYFALGIGVLFTLLTKGVQFRRFPDMIKQLRSSKSGDGGLSSFQTMALTLSSRAGVGSIAGVATAVAAGGPGAIMWMTITALLGSTCAYAEAVLAQVYKRRIRGEDRGGMPYYIKYGLRTPWLAMILALVTMIGYGFVFPGIQANNIASSVQLAFGIKGWVTGIVITGVLAIVIVGGTRRIVHVAQTIVPFMAIGYVLTAIVVIAMNLEQVPQALMLIVSSGMGTDQVFGGIIGYAVAWGVRRAIFASATGLGEGTFAAAAARTTHPGKQGIIQAFSIYIDILLICMATGLMMVVTGTYHVKDPSGGFIMNNVPGAVAGPNFVQAAIDSSLPGWGSVFVALAILLFAFTSQVFFFYVASTNLVFLLGERRSHLLETVLKVGALAISFIGAVVNADAMWAAGDIGYALIGWMNMISVLLLAPIVRKVIKDYEHQRRMGIDPVFDPHRIGIRGAEFWESKDSEERANAHGAERPGT